MKQAEKSSSWTRLLLLAHQAQVQVLPIVVGQVQMTRRRRPNTNFF